MSDSRFLHGYQRRLIDDELDQLVPMLPALLLDGPKGVGKTETALQRSATIRRLDDPRERAIVEANPDGVGSGATPVLIDEWQRVPSVWDAVKREVDQDPSGGRFLLTGSMPTIASHSGAGRITALRMRPLCLYERGVAEPTISFRELLDGNVEAPSGRSVFSLGDYVDEIIAGGLPAMRHLDDPALARQLESYLDRIVDHDVPEAGFVVRRPATLRGWLRAYAAATATTTSLTKIALAAAGRTGRRPAAETAQSYTELLTHLRVLDPVEAWLPTSNHLKRITGAPKHHLADPALAAQLLGQSREQLLRGGATTPPIVRDGTLLGALFESLVGLSIRTLARVVGANTYHLRTEGGRHEVDLIVERNTVVLAFEVKLGGAVDDRDVRHLLWLRDQVGGDLVDAAVITTGPEAYRRPDGIAVIPLALLGP